MKGAGNADRSDLCFDDPGSVSIPEVSRGRLFSRVKTSPKRLWREQAAEGISKAGDGICEDDDGARPHYILGPFGEDSDLRRWGLKLAERGGKNAKEKRAVVAVARKLAVLLIGCG